MNRLKESNVFSGGGGVIHLNNRRTLLKSYIWNYVVSNSGKATLENSIKGDINLELIGGTEQLTTTGKNLFDIKKASDVSNYITTETLAKIDITAAIVFDVKKNTNYCLSVSGKTDQPSINFNIANDVQRKSILNKLKTEETLNSLDSGKIYVGFSGGDTELNATKLSQEYFDIQLEEASSKTPYEPYTGGKPSPSPEYPQEIKNSGKWNEGTQKYEVDVKVSNCGYLQKGSYADKIRPLPLEKGKTYRIYVDVKSAVVNVCILNEERTFANSAQLYAYYNSRGYPISSTGVVSGICRLPNSLYRGYTFTVTVDGLFLYQGVNANILNTDNAYVAYDFIKKVDISSPYTEKESVVLTSDRPITKWDKLVEQGGQYGWLYGSKIYVVTGNEVFESRDGYNIESYTNRFFILNDLLKENDALKPLAYMKCLRNVQYVYSPNIFEEGFETNINQFHIKLSNDRVGILASDDHAVRTAKFSEYMKKIHKNGNPIEILYATTESQFVPISEFEQTQLRNLHSYNGTTNITVDSGEVPCGIKVAYKQKK